jgi:hypothetical protein
MKNILLLIFVAFLFTACDDTEEISSDAVILSEDDVAEESISDELDDLARITLNSEEAVGGRVRTLNDDRLDCAGTTITFSNVASDRTSGTATIQFGPGGCTDGRGNVREGQLVVTWSGGKWFHEGATHTISSNGYVYNGIRVDGERTLLVEDVSGTLSDFTILWSYTASHTFVWPDNATSSRTVVKKRQWHHTQSADTYTVSNGQSTIAVEGTNRRGVAYNMSISEPLSYELQCVRTLKHFIPVSGVKQYTNVDTNRTLTVDYGDGDCDTQFTVTAEGRSKTVDAGS